MGDMADYINDYLIPWDEPDTHELQPRVPCKYCGVVCDWGEVSPHKWRLFEDFYDESAGVVRSRLHTCDEYRKAKSNAS